MVELFMNDWVRRIVIENQNTWKQLQVAIKFDKHIVTKQWKSLFNRNLCADFYFIELLSTQIKIITILDFFCVYISKTNIYTYFCTLIKKTNLFLSDDFLESYS